MDRLIAFKGTEPYLFISYAHKNFEEVHSIISELNRLGLHIWYDEGIDPGNEWPEEIAKAIDDSSLFVVFVTKDSMASRNVHSECYYALDINKPFLAVFLEDVPYSPGLALRASSTQAIMKFRMDDRDFFTKIIQTINFKLPQILIDDSALNNYKYKNPLPIKKRKKKVLFRKEIIFGIIIIAFFIFVGFTANAIGDINQMIGQLQETNSTELNSAITEEQIVTKEVIEVSTEEETTDTSIQVVPQETVGLTTIDDIQYFNDQKIINSKSGIYITQYSENQFTLWVNRNEVANEIKNIMFVGVSSYDGNPSLSDFEAWSKNDDGVHYYEDRYGYGIGVVDGAPHCVVFLYDSNKVLVKIIEFRDYRN